MGLRRSVLALTVLAVGLTLAACGDDDSSDGSGGATSGGGTTSSGGTVSTGGAGAGTGGAGGTSAGGTSSGGAGTGGGGTGGGGTGGGGTGGTNTGGAGTGGAGTGGGGTAGPSRGYWTTPAELVAAKKKADASQEPYKSALAELVKYAGAASNWTHGTLDGAVTCGGASGGDPGVPAYIANSGGGPLVLAKAYMYRLTGDEAYATDARTRILELVDTTSWGGEVYTGANQCILNLGWFIPRFIQAADLLEGWSGWTAADKAQFQGWLATEVYKKVSASSDKRNNNWGSAGSYTAAMIADYLVGGGITELTAHDGSKLSLSAAWKHHLDKQLARMNGTEKMDSQCATWGIQAHGGIPDELRRGSSGCAATFILEQDASYTYQLAHIQSLVAHAELLWRRGSTSLWDNVASDKKGSIRQSVLFVIANPTKSWPWQFSHLVTLELGYRYYRDAKFCGELVCSDLANRKVSIAGNRVLSFATLTHGFAPSENPGPPPTSTPP